MNRNPNASNSVARMKCPNCGAKMVIRLASKGKSKGRYFWGCSTYPICEETVAAKLEDLPQRELGAIGYVTCPQCAGSGADMRTPLLRWLFSGATGLGPDLGQSRFTTAKAKDAGLSTDIERLSLHKSCQLCLGTGLRLLPSVEAARRGLAMEATIFEDAREAFRKNAQDSRLNDEQIRNARDARERYWESEDDAGDYSLLMNQMSRSHHLNRIRQSFEDAAEGQVALATEEARLNALDNEVRREELRQISVQRSKDLAIANQEYELGLTRERLEVATPGILAAMVESANRAGSIRILLGIALKIVADNAGRARAGTRPIVADGTAGQIEDEPSELASEEDLADDEDYPLDEREWSPSLELLAPEDLDSEDWVEAIFSHSSDEPNFGQQDDSPEDGEEA